MTEAIHDIWYSDEDYNYSIPNTIWFSICMLTCVVLRELETFGCYLQMQFTSGATPACFRLHTLRKLVLNFIISCTFPVDHIDCRTSLNGLPNPKVMTFLSRPGTCLRDTLSRLRARSLSCRQDDGTEHKLQLYKLKMQLLYSAVEAQFRAFFSSLTYANVISRS